VKRPVREVAVDAIAGVWLKQLEPPKEKFVTTRTAEILTIKTCAGKSDQPGSGKKGRYAIQNITTEAIHEYNDDRNAGNITEHKKPE
jgi:hypothetical protein